MIYLFTGTPGSGKSLHMAKIILNRLNSRFIKKENRNVIANFPINEKYNNNGKFLCVENENLTPELLINYACANFELGKENQCLLAIDECGILFNARDWQKNLNRMDWIKFFTQHRKLGYEIYLIVQNDRYIDRQIRNLAEYQVVHRKINNFKIGQLLPFSCFTAITYWYGANERIGSEIFSYNKKLGDLYNSYKLFDGALNNVVLNDKK